MSNIPIPSLTEWVKVHIREIFSASTTDLDAALGAFLNKKIDITFNGELISPENYKEQIEKERGVKEAKAKVHFGETVEVSNDGGSSGTVGLFFKVTIESNLTVGGAPVRNMIESSIQVTIVEDKTFKPPTGYSHGFIDNRRVSLLNQVLKEDTEDNQLPA